MQLLQIIAQFPRITQIDGVTLQALDSLRDGHAADGRFNNVLYVSNGQSIPRGLLAQDGKIQEITAGGLFAKGRQGVRQRLEDVFDISGDLFQHVQIRTAHLDPDGRLDARGQHVQTCLDGHGPGVCYSRKLDRGIHLIHQLLGSLGGIRPFVLGFESYRRFHHLQRRRIGRCLGTADLAEHMMHFRECAQDLVGLLQQFPRLGDGDPGIGGRHIEDVAFVQRWHEFRTQFRDRVIGRGQRQHGGADDGFFPAHDPGDDRPVQPDQQTVHRVFSFRQDPAADEEQHQHRHQRN